MYFIRSSVLLLAVSLPYAHADNSLFIPGFDAQPLSVNNLGVNSNGRTTWQILPGAPSGTFAQAAFTGTATLVEGPNDAHIHYEYLPFDVMLDITCNIANNLAACTASEGYQLTPMPFPTTPVIPLLVQGGAPLTSTGTSPSIPQAPSMVPSTSLVTSPLPASTTSVTLGSSLPAESSSSQSFSSGKTSFVASSVPRTASSIGAPVVSSTTGTSASGGSVSTSTTPDRARNLEVGLVILFNVVGVVTALLAQ